jgi:hypothetical protein
MGLMFAAFDNAMQSQFPVALEHLPMSSIHALYDSFQVHKGDMKALVSWYFAPSNR